MQPPATTKGLLQHAEHCAPGERSGLLLQAQAVAKCADDWQGVGDAWARDGHREAAERCLEAALQDSPTGVWVHRHAAATRVLLGDRTRAIANLVRVERAAMVRHDRCPHPEHGFVLGATFFNLRVETWKRLLQATFASLPMDPTRPALTQVRKQFLSA